MDPRPFPWGDPRGWTGARPSTDRPTAPQRRPGAAQRVQRRVMPRRVLWGTAKVLVTALAAAVLGSSWFGWSQVQRINDSLGSSNALDQLGSGSVEDQNILLVGLDARTDAQGNPLPQALLDQLHAGTSNDGSDKTDTIIVLHISDNGAKAVGVSIPRDSYVELADGSGKHKINTAYGAAKDDALTRLRAQGVTGPELEVQAAEQSAQATIATVEQFTGITIDHYAAVNLAGFYNIAQAVGGVQVCLNNPVRDSEYSGANFPAGLQTIDGSQVLAFIRQRHELPNGDLDRERRQQALLASLAHSVLSAGTLTDSGKLDAVLTAAKQTVAVDPGWDPVGLVRVLSRVSGGDVGFTTIPVISLSLQTPYDGDAVQVDPVAVRRFFTTVLGGTPAQAANAPIEATEPAAAGLGLATAAPSIQAAAPVQPPATTAEPPITASGVTCVN